MPELPEVETIRSGLAKAITGKNIVDGKVFQYQLRQQVPNNFITTILGKRVEDVARRGKYLLVHLDQGTILWHLGMSGSIWLHQGEYCKAKHDHILIRFDQDLTLCYNDPRRFGMVDYSQSYLTHKLLKNLGPEPLSNEFVSDYLFAISRKRTVAIKNLIMNSHIVVGIGNIYACESLYHAGIRPTREASSLSRKDCNRLVEAIEKTLKSAIAQGGTTLKDYVNSDGNPGYFQQKLFVYSRGNQKCHRCTRQLASIRLANRATVYCPSCQK